MNCVKGDLAEVVGATVTPGLKGLFVVVEERYVAGTIFRGRLIEAGGPSWVCRSAVTGGLLPTAVESYFGEIRTEHHQHRVIGDEFLRPIRDTPGNEDFVVKARKTLPRAKPVTGPVTIDNRGEVKA